MMKLTTRLLGASMLLLALPGSAQAAVNLVQNGSFETTTLTNSGQITNTDLSGWQNPDYAGQVYGFYIMLYFPDTATTTGAALLDPNTGVTQHITLAGNNGFVGSPDGGNFVASDGDTRVNRPITQTVIGLTAMHSYTLTFYDAAAQFAGYSGQTKDYWSVSLGNDTQFSPTITNPNQGFTGWFAQTMHFTATSSSELLSFLAVGTPNGFPPTALLDGVSLTDDAALPVDSVPEPATWAMLLIGMGAVGLTARRHRSGALTA